MRLRGPGAALTASCVLTAGALAGCGGPQAAEPAATPFWRPAAQPTHASVVERCQAGAGGEQLTFTAKDGSLLPGAVFGSGDRAAVFVHQTGSTGMCGWVPYAEWAGRHGVRAIVLDVCGYGESQCSPAFGKDIAGQLRLPVAWARAHGATTVTLVGASMGGSLVTGVGQRLGVDAIVDVSSPPEWEGVPSVPEAARSITVPFLMIAATSDTEIQPGLLRTALRSSPSEHKRFIGVPEGHGYTIVTNGSIMNVEITAVGRRVLDWVNGNRR
ncbi:MAG: alpha/beta hydrolase [Marmoricola sp.]